VSDSVGSLSHAPCMRSYRGATSTVQVRDVSPETLALLKRRAAAQGASLSEYLRRGAPKLPDPVTELGKARSERPGA
jgi:hypothetical protein